MVTCPKTSPRGHFLRLLQEAEKHCGNWVWCLSTCCMHSPIVDAERGRVPRRVGPTSPRRSQPFVRVEIRRKTWAGDSGVCLLIQKLPFPMRGDSFTTGRSVRRAFHSSWNWGFLPSVSLCTLPFRRFDSGKLSTQAWCLALRTVTVTRKHTGCQAGSWRQPGLVTSFQIECGSEG